MAEHTPKRSAATKRTTTDRVRGSGGLTGPARGGRDWNVSERGPYQIPRPDNRGK